MFWLLLSLVSNFTLLHTIGRLSSDGSVASVVTTLQENESGETLAGIYSIK